MKTHARRLTAAVVSALVLALAGGDGGRAANVPQAISGEMVLLRIEPDELTKYLHKIIQEELTAPAPDERAVQKLRATALLIAAQAQSGRGGRDVWQRAALRDNALKLQKALADGKTDAARKHAVTLFDMGGVPPDTRRIDLKGLMELDEVESLMAPRRRGGLGFGPKGPAPNNRDGVEIKLIFLARKAPTAAELDAEAEHLARAAQVTAAMANLLDAYTPDKKMGMKDPKDWKAWLDEMRTAAAELEGAARAKDPNRVKAAATKVTASCNNCHEVFRD
jgi:hypothetical protein